MSEKKLPLKPNGMDHIYNRGINGCSFFYEKTNYDQFLGLFEKYIVPIAHIYAWVLMGNHFHFMLRIRPEEELETLFATKVKEGVFRSMDMEQRINRQFSNLFNAYSKAFNKKYKRTGSLIEHGFRRIKVEGKPMNGV